ncbi:MAG: hypothetical protein V2J07_06755 [Anaerolineae bacterium]|jgi:hypothetical protein|nr:hypothetical protein [Anaerolineae bacterium]
MARLSTWLQKKSTGWVAVIAVIIFLVFTATVLPMQAEQAAATANGADSPDSSFFYSTTDLYDSAETFGEEGRSAYIQARWSFDVVWPLVYTFFLVTTISWFFKNAFPTDSKLQLANLVPVLGMVFDFLENSATTIVMARFPEMSPVAGFLAPIFTPIKWLFVNGSFVVLLIGAAFLIRNRIQKRKG